MTVDLKLTSRDYFPLGIAAAIVAFLVLFRVVTGAGFAFHPSPAHPDYLPTGFIGDIRDNYTYAGWAQQARAGRTLFFDAHTTDPHEAIYVNPYYLAVGRLARWLGVQPFPIMHLLGILGAGVVTFNAYFIARHAGFSRSAARWACVLVPFAMGWSAIAAGACIVLGIPPMADTQTLGADIWYHDAYGFNCFLTMPYQSFGWGVLSIVVLQLTACLRDDVTARTLRWRLIALGLSSALLASIRPYEPVMMLASYGLFAAAALLNRPIRQMRGRRLVLVGLVLGITAVPFVLYQVWVTKQPVWDYFTALASIVYRRRMSWIIGYGTLLPLAIYTSVVVFRRAEFFAARWLACWVGLLVVLLIVVETGRTKIASGGTVPMCVLASFACAALVDRCRAADTRRQRQAAMVAMLTFGASLFVTTPAFAVMLGRHFNYERSAYPAGLLEAAQKARELQDWPAILCDDATGNILAGIAPVRIYIGHGALTPDYENRLRLVANAGFTSEHGDAGSFDRLLNASRVNFILVRSDSGAFKFAQKHPSLTHAGNFGDYVLFRIDS